MHIDNMAPAALSQLAEQLEQDYLQLQQSGLALDLTRGKPSAEQLALSNTLDGILAGDFKDADGVDVRNYGGLLGLREARELFAQVLGAHAEQTLAGGNSSLTMMYQVIEFALNKGLRGTPWREAGPVKFLCPVPGYDRHFAICEHLGIEMIPVAMDEHGPDMEQVETLVQADPTIKGLWCVPRFSNPTGVVYSDATVERIARLGQLAGPDFIVMWDNAYAMHALQPDAPALANINDYCDRFETANSVFQFGSTSKISFAGAGVAFLATGAENFSALTDHLAFSTIGPDKVNQLRHLRLFPNRQALQAHMDKHSALLAPRFASVVKHLEQGLAGTGMGSWNKPAGGYFVSFDALPGLASTIVSLAGTIGVKLTPAGATWPYGKDPQDSNIRLAPSFASVADVDAAMQAFVVCVKLASLRQRLQAS